MGVRIKYKNKIKTKAFIQGNIKLPEPIIQMQRKYTIWIRPKWFAVGTYLVERSLCHFVLYTRLNCWQHLKNKLFLGCPDFFRDYETMIASGLEEISILVNYTTRN